MSSLKPIKDRISSIDKIAKITQAMEVVSIFRLRKVEKKTQAYKEYFAAFKEMVERAAGYINYAAHKFFSLRRSDKPLVVCLGSDKGLCGGFNLFVLKSLISFKEKNRAKIIVCGRRLAGIKRMFAQDVVGFYELSGLDLNALAQGIFSDLMQGRYDSLFIIYNRFRHSIVGGATLLQLVPLAKKKEQDRDFILEASDLWEDLFFRYIEQALSSVILESQAAEEFTRVLTMRQAKDNAGDLRKKVNLQFHKLRQNLITRELADISGILRN
jgi:F-type H+-transporting ATPase subunit gamma